MYQGIFHNGEWKRSFAWIPVKTNKVWLWLRPYNVRRITFMVPEKGFTMSYCEREILKNDRQS